MSSFFPAPLFLLHRSPVSSVLSLILAFNVLQIANNIDSCIVHDISHDSAFDYALYLPRMPLPMSLSVWQPFKCDFFQEDIPEISSWANGLPSEFPSAVMINPVSSRGGPPYLWVNAWYSQPTQIFFSVSLFPRLQASWDQGPCFIHIVHICIPGVRPKAWMEYGGCSVIVL